MLNRSVLICAAALMACAVDPLSPDQEPLHVVGVDTESVMVHNRSQRPVYYRVTLLNSVGWAPCTSPADCPEIPAQAMVRIRFADIGLSRPDNTEAKLRWWRFARVGDEYVVRGEGRLPIRML